MSLSRRERSSSAPRSGCVLVFPRVAAALRQAGGGCWRRLRGAAILAAAVASVVAMPAGCKGGVVPGKDYENSSFDVPASLVGALSQDSRPIASVIWTDPLQRRPDVPMPARWIDSTVASAVAAMAGGGGDGGASAAFTMRLFRPPPPEALVEIPSPAGGDGARLALGELVIVDDGDGDGSFQIDGHGTIIGGAGTDARDRYLAGSTHVLVYVDRPFPPNVPADFPLGPGSGTGYQLLRYVCEGRLVARVTAAAVAELEPQTAGELVQRRTCMRTHSP